MAGTCRVIGAALLALLSVSRSDGQLIKKFGLKGGFISAGQKYNFSITTDPEIVRRSGFGVAGFIEWFDHPVFSVVTQVEYVQKGMGSTFGVTTPGSPTPTGTVTLYNRLDYISLPVLVKLSIPAGSATPYAIAGVRIDHLLGFESDEGAFDILYERFDRNLPGATIGAGVELGSVMPVGILAEVRYNIDLSDSYLTDVLEVSNNTFDFWLGICF